MKKGPFQNAVIFLILVVLGVSLIFGQVRTSGLFRTIDGGIYDTVSAVRLTLIEQPVRTVKHIVSDYVSLWQVRQENDALRRSVDSVAALQAKNTELQRQIDELKELLALEKTLTDVTTIQTTVVSRDPSLWQSLLSVSVGTADGVAVDDALMSSKGMLGKVVSVSEHRATVRLLTDQDQPIQAAIRIQTGSGSVEGVLDHYNVDQGVFVIKLLETATQLEPGTSVVTSGMGGLFPAGLLVGTVTEVSAVSDSLSVEVLVKPAADFDTFSVVSVVKRS